MSTRDARNTPVESAHASSLHPPPTSCLCRQSGVRTYSTVSKFVVPPHVSIRATPEAVGVHSYACSGAVPVSTAQLPLWALLPLVVPVNAPPSGGMMIGFSLAAGAPLSAHVPGADVAPTIRT